MLALKDVSKAYGSVKVLEHASLEVNPKDCLCIMGGAGSGKSTILKLFIRLEKPTDGTVMVDGIDLAIVPSAALQLYRRRIGIVFQEPVLLTHATVAENIALPLELMGAPASIVRRNTTDLLQRLGLEDKAQRLPDELSLSERSLTAIARAIVAAPMILLLDDPLTHLDPVQAKAVTELVSAMRESGSTIVLFGRDNQAASLFGARTVELKNGSISTPASPAKSSDGDTHHIFEDGDASAGEGHDDTAKSSKRKIRITALRSDSQDSR